MKIVRFLQSACLLTVLALTYIHLQMRIFDLAYQAKTKEKKIIELSEGNGMLACNILKMKSSSHIGEALLNEDSQLRFRDLSHVVELVDPEAQEDVALPAEAPEPPEKHPLLSLLSFTGEARAEAPEDSDPLKPWRRR